MGCLLYLWDNHETLSVLAHLAVLSNQCWPWVWGWGQGKQPELRFEHRGVPKICPEPMWGSALWRVSRVWVILTRGAITASVKRGLALFTLLGCHGPLC